MQIAPSYDFDRFSDADSAAELGRLQRQATLVLDRELAMLRDAGLASGADTAEIGCGPGFLTGALAGVAAPGRTLGIDSSAELLRIARTAIEPEHPNLTFVDGNAYATGLPDDSLDFVYSRFLYQHLDTPALALREAKRVLRPGGRICVVDVDDAWLTLEPTSEAFARLSQAALEGQARRGGDRQIGRKLPGLMKRAGFAPVAVHVMSVTSLEVGLETFLDITTRFKAVQAQSADGEMLVEEARRDAVRQDAFGVVGVFVAVGTA